MIYVSTLDAFVIDGFYRLLGRRRHAPRRALAAAEVKAAEREADLPRYRDNERLLRALGEDAFAAGIETRVRRLHAARLELADARARVVSHELPTVPQLRAKWPDLDVPQQRALISQVIDCIYLASGRGFVEHRVTICPLGTAPIPRWRGQGPGDTILPLQPRRRWLNPTPGPTGRRKLKTRAVEPQ